MPTHSHGEKKAVREAKEARYNQEEEAEHSEEEMSEVDSSNAGSDYEMPSSGSEEESDSGSESGSSLEEAPSKRLVKRKRKVQPKTPIKRSKKSDEKDTKVKAPKPSTSKESKSKSVVAEKTKKTVEDVKPTKGEEKGFDSNTLEEKDEKDEKKDEGGKKSNKKEVPLFNDKNVDYNLFNDAPENVMARKIKISNTVMVTCKMIDAISGGANGLSYDYAALTFVRKIQNAKAFEFNLPLTLVPSIIEALKLIVKDNPKFFKKHHHSPNA